jgi:hypothetical protein
MLDEHVLFFIALVFLNLYLIIVDDLTLMATFKNSFNFDELVCYLDNEI